MTQVGQEAAAQPRVRQGRWLAGLVEGADVDDQEPDLLRTVRSALGR